MGSLTKLFTAATAMQRLERAASISTPDVAAARGRSGAGALAEPVTLARLSIHTRSSPWRARQDVAIAADRVHERSRHSGGAPDWPEVT
jgi:hypothetical protein